MVAQISSLDVRFAASSFSPSLKMEDIARLRETARTVGGMSRDYMNQLIAMLESFLSTPESKRNPVISPDGRITHIPLEDEEVQRIYDLVPWRPELDMMSKVFDQEMPDYKCKMRNDAYHLLWYGKELLKDIEPVTIEMRARLARTTFVTNTKHSNAIRTVGCDAIVDYLDTGTGAATIVIYSGSRPTNITDASSAGVLGTLTFQTTAFQAASNGVATVTSSITSDTSADASGDATHYRIRRGAGGDTAAVMEGTAGDTGEEVNFNNNTIVIGGTIAISTMTYTVPAGT